MALYPLDALRNAPIDRQIEPVLEDVREDLAAGGTWVGFPAADVLEVFDAARPRLNVLCNLIIARPGARVIDVGTGLGLLPVVLQRLGVECVCTELDPSLAEFAAGRGIEVRPYRLGDSPPYPQASFDLAVLAEVLEHVKMPPMRVVQEVASLLRPGGRLLLTTPNVARLAHVEALAAGENFLEPFPEDVPPGADATDWIEHVREYSVREVVEATEAAGLEVEQVLMTGWGPGGYDPIPNPWANEIIVLEAIRT